MEMGVFVVDDKAVMSVNVLRACGQLCGKSQLKSFTEAARQAPKSPQLEAIERKWVTAQFMVVPLIVTCVTKLIRRNK